MTANKIYDLLRSNTIGFNYILDDRDLKNLCFKYPLDEYAKQLYRCDNKLLKNSSIRINNLLEATHVDKWNKDKTYRLLQTTSFIYKVRITQFMLLICYLFYNKKITEYEFNNYKLALITQHNINLEYEVNNPCIVYNSKKQSKSKKEKVIKEKVNKPKKESKAEAKLKKKAETFSKLIFKPTKI